MNGCKIAAIYHAWDGVELLNGSIDCIKDHVDLIIIVYQDVSNWGEYYNPLPDFKRHGLNYILVKYEPKIKDGRINEIAKRNLGLKIAKENNCTHFLHLDCDEYYDNFEEAKRLYFASRAGGSVCRLYTYFKSAEWRFKYPDDYFVPFIHRLKKNTVAGYRHYNFNVDPTRKVNELNVVELPVFMHHYSWVRKDIERKCRNSTARERILKGNMLNYHKGNLRNGLYIADYGQQLIRVPNQFNIQV